MTRKEARYWLKIELKTWGDECKSKLPIKEALSVAIKLLEQEPCEEQEIYEKSYKEGYDKGWSDGNFIGANRWIIVGERMPKPNETEHMIAKYYLVQNEYRDMMVARWDGKGWKQMYQPNSYLEDDVIAWMPLPSPYELQDSEEE